MVLNLAPVIKLRIVSPQKYLDSLVETLYAFGAIQVEQSAMPELDKPMARFEQISEMLVRLRSVEKRLGIDENAAKPATGLSFDQLYSQTSKIDFGQVRQIDQELESVNDEYSKLEERQKELAPFRELRVSPQLLKKTPGKLKFIYFSLKPGELLDTLEQLQGAIERYDHELTLVESDGGHYVLLAYDQRFEEKIYLSVLRFARQILAFPAIDSVSYGVEVGKVEAKMKSLDNRRHELEAGLDKFKRENQLQIVRLRKALEVESKKATLPVKFGRTRNLVVVEGWIKQDRRKELEKMLDKVTDHAVVIEQVKTFEEPPTILQNPALIRPFEFFVKFFSLPSSGEYDPTVFVSLFFPIFFGMIVGDVAYGIAAIFLAIFLRFKMKDAFWKSASGIMLLSAISTTLFGFVYGEFLGTPDVLGMYHLHEYIPRMETEGVTLLMGLALGLGLVHVSLGFLIGAVTNFVHGHTRHAIGKTSWLLLIAGIIAVVPRFAAPELLGADFAMGLSNVGALTILVGLGGIVWAEGFAGVIELFGVISNVFSYLRLMALGVGAAILASLITNMLRPETKPIMDMLAGTAEFDMVKVLVIILAATFFIVGHAMALGLGLFEGSIHSMRLHFVEFFSKFYHGGGKAFVPLRSDE